MSGNRSLAEYKSLIRTCVKCGVCQAHCPAYSVTKKEGAVARGKITMAAALLAGDTELEKRLQEDISLCLMCGSCYAKCPNKVPTHEIVGAVRREITNSQGLSLIGKGVSTAIGSPLLLKAFLKSGAFLSPLLFKKIPMTSGLRLRFFQAPGMKGRTLPPIADRDLFSRIPEFVAGEPGKPTVGFFAGCAITYLYPEIGEKMVRILTTLGYSVYTPRVQGCCGIPALSAGNGNLVEELAERNMNAFKKREIDNIITACASCHGGIGAYYSTMKNDHREFSRKVVDISVFLREQQVFSELELRAKWPNRKKVTYHDPCHLKVQGITRQPRELLRILPNIEFVEMENAASCCGLGGTFSVYHYKEAKKIGERKIIGLKQSGAEMVATACPGCIMQLQDSINHAGLRIKAVHLLDLLEEASMGSLKKSCCRENQIAKEKNRQQKSSSFVSHPSEKYPG